MIYVGVDVDKRKLKCALLLSQDKFRPKTVANTSAGFEALVEWALRIAKCSIDQIAFVMEATGVYHQQAAISLHEAGATVFVCNPHQVREFAKGRGVRSKTDQVDARVLADFGKSSPKLYPYTPEPRFLCDLKQLQSRLIAVEKDLHRERNRLEKAHVAKASARVMGSIEEAIAFHKKQAETLQKEIDDHIDQDPTLKSDKALLKSVPAIGDTSASHLLSLFHSRPFESAKAMVAFVGIDPKIKQSGETEKKSVISRQGHSDLRRIFYMPTLSAVRYNPIVKAYYQGLVARGKPKMVALIAAMRKLLHIAFGVLKNQTPFNEKHGLQA